MVSAPSIVKLAGVVVPELSVSLAARIAAGGYDWHDDAITQKRFPLTLPAPSRNLVLVHFDEVITSKGAEAWASENGFELGLIDDLLAIGSHPKHRELQRQFPIIALGSSAVIHGHRRVPFLDGLDAGRYLRLIWCESGWRGRYRFLMRNV